MSKCRLERSPREAGKTSPVTTPTLRVPVVPDDMVEHLRDTFRPRVDPAFDLREYDRQVGKQEVIEYLQKLWVEQNPKE
jgi:hypothetical protein